MKEEIQRVTDMGTSILKWSFKIDDAPYDDYILVIYQDDRGDYTSYDTLVAWQTFGGEWIANDEVLCRDNIIAWTRFPHWNEIKR